jgi:hypothetical protein
MEKNILLKNDEDIKNMNEIINFFIHMAQFRKPDQDTLEFALIMRRWLE